MIAWPIAGELKKKRIWVFDGGDPFPHLYGALPLPAVLWVKPLPLGTDGRHVFPEHLP